MKKIYTLLLVIFTATSFLTAQTLWDNFEDTRKGTYGFISGTFIPYTLNPDQNGANTSEVAASYTRNPAEQFDVIVYDAQMADLSDYLSSTKQMTMDVWSPAAGTTVQITLENDVLALPDNFPDGRHSVYLATTTVAMGWETLTFSFDNQPDASVASDNVNRVVILFAPDTNTDGTYFWDNFNGPEFADDPCEGATENPEILNDFECNQNVNFTFSHSGVNFKRIINPDQNGNESEYVAQYIRNAGELNDVLIGQFDGNLMLQSNSSLSLDVWDPLPPTKIRLSLQNAAGDVIIQMDEETSVAGGWETLTYNPTSVADAMDIEQFVILFDPETNTSEQYFFDNFGFGAPVAVEELAAVNSFTATPNPTQGETTFNYDLNSAANVNLSIFDLTGKKVAQLVDSRQLSGTHQVQWLAEDIANGIYFYSVTIDGEIASGKIVLNK